MLCCDTLLLVCVSIGYWVVCIFQMMNLMVNWGHTQVVTRIYINGYIRRATAPQCGVLIIFVFSLSLSLLWKKNLALFTRSWGPVWHLVYRLEYSNLYICSVRLINYSSATLDTLLLRFNLVIITDLVISEYCVSRSVWIFRDLYHSNSCELRMVCYMAILALRQGGSYRMSRCFILPVPYINGLTMIH